IEMKDQFPLDKPGYVYSFTSVNRDRSGAESDSPITVGLVKFEGVKGGIVHFLDVDPDQVSIGMKVAPFLKNQSERTGDITDIRAFKPVSTAPSKMTPEGGKAERRDVRPRENPARLLLRS